MPTRTEIVISLGEVLECLPPSKKHKRRRYNSFDANIGPEEGNEENLAPSCGVKPCGDMKPDHRVNDGPELLSIKSKKRKDRKKSDDTDEEVSFRDVKTNGETSDELKSKSKRKSNAEKFLEDNANYFQLEVLNSKTRSNKLVNETEVNDSEEEKSEEGGFHSSFLDFLKAKGVSKENGVGRVRHKSEESERSTSRGQAGRSRSSHSRYGRSRSSGRERTRSRSRPGRTALGPDGSEVFVSESESSECSVRLPRLALTRPGRSDSPSEDSDSHQRGRRTRSAARDDSPDRESSGRKPRGRQRRSSPANSEPGGTSRRRRGRSRNNRSPSGSEAESVASNSRHTKDESDDEDKDKLTPSKRGRRSELDKLLEAVDTSFHFETAAAERKRLSDQGGSGGGLGPLEIDCSDTGSEASYAAASSKRRLPETGEPSNKKKFRPSNNLLKTASPGTPLKLEDVSGASGDELDLELESDRLWDGWDELNEQLDNISEDPVTIEKMHFSFESVPMRESWYGTYQRQDRGDELVFYPSSTTAPFQLPYEMPYSLFSGAKPLKKETADNSRDQSKASSPVRNLGSKDKRKISECESTSSEDTRRRPGRPGRPSKADTLGGARVAAHLLESHYRVSPRCHASTKSLGLVTNTPGDLEGLEEAFLYQDEKELNLHNLPSFLPRDENSNDSLSSGSVNSRAKSESSAELVQLACKLDSVLQHPGDLAQPAAQEDAANPVPAKVPPTRSRISSEQLLSPKKTKKKKKMEPCYEPLDQLVADNVDPLLLDCLEDELPTVPLNTVMADTLDLLDSYNTCTSMSVCNSRWLRPNKRDSLMSSMTATPEFKPKRKFIYKDDLPGFNIDSDLEAEKLPVSKRGKKVRKSELKTEETEAVEESTETKQKQKKLPSPNKTNPSKTKRKFIYKDDLPGFSLDSDTETEKLPVSKARRKPEPNKVKDPVDDDKSDEDTESVESFNSSSSAGSKKRRKANKTGFPLPKKKKKKIEDNSEEKMMSSKSEQKSPRKSRTLDDKKKISTQPKLDRFLTKTKRSIDNTEPSVDLLDSKVSDRKAKAAKNYR